MRKEFCTGKERSHIAEALATLVRDRLPLLLGSQDHIHPENRYSIVDVRTEKKKDSTLIYITVDGPDPDAYWREHPAMDMDIDIHFKEKGGS